ncbi:hypothetical protein [Georgenia sp. SUBG003]|uniref:hypothetical protein n=1 Tax=Georgenia sp. SUBG003 TaxID=1497974 RepID=UPI003AB32DD5
MEVDTLGGDVAGHKDADGRGRLLEGLDDLLLGHEEPEANDTETYDNGVKVVPSYLLESDIVYADNIQPLLVDSGYYTTEQVESGQS